VAGVLLLAWAIFYFAPVTGAALADSPVGPFSTFVLREAGLGNGSAVISQDSSASQSGVTVRLFGVSANPIHTVVLLRFTPAGTGFVYANLTDQFGVSYDIRGGVGDLRTGDIALEFAPPNAVTSTLGMRFTLTMTLDRPDGTVVPGSWVIHGIAVPHSSVAIAAPQPATTGSVRVTFSGGREADGIIELPATLYGVTADQLGLSRKQQPGEEPPLTIEVVDSAGMHLEVPYQLSNSSDRVGIDIFAYGAASHGTYTVRITIKGAGTVERSVSY
jgi:hypothetical protein